MARRLELLRIGDPDDHRTVVLKGSPFTIGRSPDCDLTIADDRLSRFHLRIETSDQEFVAEDLNSSNGTLINGDELIEPRPLSDGDELDLGGVRFNVRIIEEEPEHTAQPAFAPPSAAVNRNIQESSSVSIKRPLTLYLIAAPVVALMLVIIAGISAYLISISGNPGPILDSVNGEPADELPVNKRQSKNGADSTASPQVTSLPAVTPSASANSSGEITSTSGTARTEQYATRFLRRIARNDPRAFLTADQAKRLEPAIGRAAGNTSLPANLASAKRNAAAISTLAVSMNLKPQFLAVAAIERLGNSRGDVLGAAREIAEILNKLETHIGNELSDDALLMIAAYGQGEAGQFLKMRDMLQALANEFPDSSRSIRSIWFLEEKKRISPADFERALRFLAIGTIAESPKEFGVDAEPLVL